MTTDWKCRGCGMKYTDYVKEIYFTTDPRVRKCCPDSDFHPEKASLTFKEAKKKND